jgi:hypothetical protein
MTYDLPIGKGKPILDRGGVLNYILGGWSMAWSYSIFSGNPINIGAAPSEPNWKTPTRAGNARAL